MNTNQNCIHVNMLWIGKNATMIIRSDKHCSLDSNCDCDVSAQIVSLSDRHVLRIIYVPIVTNEPMQTVNIIIIIIFSCYFRYNLHYNKSRRKNYCCYTKTNNYAHQPSLVTTTMAINYNWPSAKPILCD